MTTPWIDITRGSMEDISMYTTRELAERLRISEDHIRRMVSQRTIPFVKIGRMVRFAPEDIERWLATKRVYTKREIDKIATTMVAINDMKGKGGKAIRPSVK